MSLTHQESARIEEILRSESGAHQASQEAIRRSEHPGQQRIDTIALSLINLADELDRYRKYRHELERRLADARQLIRE